jgi:integrase
LDGISYENVGLHRAHSCAKRAVKVLRECAAAGSAPFVFSAGLVGKKVNQPNGKQWLRALAALGFEDFRWHDLRHTWASWHVQHGTPLAEIQRLGGWKTISMVMVYSHLETLQLRKSVRRFELLRLRA